MVFRKISYRLRMAVPNLSIGARCLVFVDSSTPCFVVSTRGWTPLFFLCFDHGWLFLRNPINKIKKSVVEGIFGQSGPASSRIPDRPKVNFDRSRMALRQECFGNHYLSEFRKQTGRQWEKPKKANIVARAREKASWHGYVPPSRWRQNHHARGWPKTTVWPWCKRCDKILRCRILRFWHSVTGP